ncbi:MAG: spermidine synthase [Alphaproteobacteria bacterium]|nr:spermidine synthase [Alphaproteobacteria bacterium]
MRHRSASALPEVNFSDHGPIRYLHLGTEWIQGSMRVDDPDAIQLEYVQRMMAGLLFVPLDDVPEQHAMQLGLGAAALTKFCHKRLHCRTTAIEINPQVVAACRLWFKLAADDERLSVILGDAQEVAAHAHWRHQIDLLHVDLYDHEAASPVLDSPEFYGHCRQLLTDIGVMTVNLFGRSMSYERSLRHIIEAFSDSAVWAFKPTREGNTVVLALRTPVRPTREQLATQAERIEEKWPSLPAQRWVKALSPVS